MLDLVVVGKFGRPYGIKGAVFINAYTDSLEDFMHYSCFYIQDKQEWVKVDLYEKSLYNKGLVCKVRGYADRTAVQALTNKELAILRAELPALPAGEYYRHELEGLKVYNATKEMLGVVEEILSTGANDVLYVQGESLYLIPYVKKYLIKVDIVAKELIVDWDINDAEDRTS